MKPKDYSMVIAGVKILEAKFKDIRSKK